MNIRQEYQARVPCLTTLANEIKNSIEELLKSVPRIDSISIRVKSIDSFEGKATQEYDSGELKYPNPFMDIQDQIGARIVVCYKSDVEGVVKIIVDHFREIENIHKVDNEADRFSYEAKHLMCLIPHMISDKCSTKYIDFFEVQVSTLFQHAWAQANHDLGYKTDAPIDFETKRKIAWVAAQAWGADTIFDELWNSRDSIEHD